MAIRFTDWGLQRLIQAQATNQAIMIASVGISTEEVDIEAQALKQEATRLPAKNVTVVDKELRLEVDLPIELTGNIIINSIVVYDMSGSVLAIGNIPPVEPMVVNRKYSLDIRIKIANAEIVHFYEMHNYNVDITRLFGDLKSNTTTQLAAVTAKVDQSVDELNKKVNNTTTDLTERVNRSLSDANNQLNSSLTNIRKEVNDTLATVRGKLFDPTKLTSISINTIERNISWADGYTSTGGGDYIRMVKDRVRTVFTYDGVNYNTSEWTTNSFAVVEDHHWSNNNHNN